MGPKIISLIDGFPLLPGPLERSSTIAVSVIVFIPFRPLISYTCLSNVSAREIHRYRNTFTSCCDLFTLFRCFREEEERKIQALYTG